MQFTFKVLGQVAVELGSGEEGSNIKHTHVFATTLCCILYCVRLCAVLCKVAPATMICYMLHNIFRVQCFEISLGGQTINLNKFRPKLDPLGQKFRLKKRFSAIKTHIQLVHSTNTAQILIEETILMSLRIKVTTQQYSIRCVFNKSGGVSKKWWSEPYSRPPHLMH